MPFLASLDHLVLTVADVQKTIDFYCGVLGCEEITFGDNRKAILLIQCTIRRLGLQRTTVLPTIPRQTMSMSGRIILFRWITWPQKRYKKAILCPMRNR